MEENNKEKVEISTIELRQKEYKEAVINALRETPIVQYACKRAGIGRTTFYRYYHDDADFASSVDEAITEGSSIVSDLAESQLISAIRSGDLSGIKYWLSNHHPTYAAKLHVTTESPKKEKELSPEQKVAIEEALNMINLDEQDATEAKDEKPREKQMGEDSK
jgi:hypothetical protein